MSYALSPLTDDIAAAYPRLFSEEEMADKGPSALAWRFSECPDGPGLFAVARDAAKDGQIVGLIGLVATDVKLGGSRCTAYQAIDTVVDTTYRGRGLFGGLGEVAHERLPEHGGRLIWGFPNANAAPGWFGRLGWSNFGQVPFLVRPLRSGYFMRRAHRRLGWVDLPLIRRPKVPSGLHREIFSFGREVEPILASHAARISSGRVQSVDYLNWRLCRHPRRTYRTMGCYDAQGTLTGFVSLAFAEKHGGSIVYVMEALAAPGGERATRRLLGTELARAAGLGAEVALAWCPADAPNRSVYARCGFAALPERLRPVDIHFGARSLTGVVLARRGWYLSYLDSDTV